MHHHQLNKILFKLFYFLGFDWFDSIFFLIVLINRCVKLCMIIFRIVWLPQKEHTANCDCKITFGTYRISPRRNVQEKKRRRNEKIWKQTKKSLTKRDICVCDIINRWKGYAKCFSSDCKIGKFNWFWLNVGLFSYFGFCFLFVIWLML